MNKLVLAAVVALGTVSLAGCDYFGSEEQKAFKQFVEKCKKDSSTADCKAWEESKNAPTGN
jgi:outer membrane murein-binding lipoprotein Lpp